jgi:pimeloyl-ACP methyl ester carboxylesterase
VSVSFVDIAWAGRPVRIEHAWVGAEGAPLAVFLHEGLGSLAMWKDFPQRLCEAAGLRGLVYSRPGYGRSTPRAADERWGVDFMHRQAFEVLPALLRALGLWDMGEPYTLIGHSDGGSIALLHAARFADQVSRCVVLAPHILVEDLSVASIEQARKAYEQGDLKRGLSKYHDDADSAFYGWNRIWLDPAFRRWRIATAVQALRCPVLAVQGLDDPYGTLEQIRGIQRLYPPTQLLELPACGHSPHRDQPAALIQAVTTFLNTNGDLA